MVVLKLKNLILVFVNIDFFRRINDLEKSEPSSNTDVLVGMRRVQISNTLFHTDIFGTCLHLFDIVGASRRHVQALIKR